MVKTMLLYTHANYLILYSCYINYYYLLLEITTRSSQRFRKARYKSCISGKQVYISRFATDLHLHHFICEDIPSHETFRYEEPNI